IRPVSLIGTELTLAHSNKFMIDWVRDNLLDVLVQDLEAQLGQRCQVNFIVRDRPDGEDQGEPTTPLRPPATSSDPPASARTLAINPKYTFDSFVVGP